MRLAHLARQHRWDVDGYLIGHGSPPLRDLHVDDALAFIWWFFTREAEKDEVDKFRVRLWIPPTPTTPIPASSPWSAESETRAFAAFKAETMG